MCVGYQISEILLKVEISRTHRQYATRVSPILSGKGVGVELPKLASPDIPAARFVFQTRRQLSWRRDRKGHELTANSTHANLKRHRAIMRNEQSTVLPKSQSALVQNANGAPKLADGVSLPTLTAGTVIVKTVAVALNPADHKMGTAFPTPGAIIGMDFSGLVAEIHPDTQTGLRVGDRVCGQVHGSNPGDPSNGAFAEYTRARADLLLRVPPGLSMEQAATLGVGLMTNALSLWTEDALALESVPATPESPAARPFPVLVYGGSTATGTLATQLLRLSGLDPVVTCSPRNFELVGARGVQGGDAIDYVRPDAVEEIRKRCNATRGGGQLRHAYDCIADPASVSHCYAALGRAGGRYVSLEVVPEELRTRRAVQHRDVLCYEGFGEDVPLSGSYERPADPAKLALVVKYFAVFQKLLDQGKLVAHPVQKVEGGLAGVLEGLKLLKSGSVSGRKLVATL